MSTNVEATILPPQLPPKLTQLPRVAILHVRAMQTHKPPIYTDHRHASLAPQLQLLIFITEPQWPSSQS